MNAVHKIIQDIKNLPDILDYYDEKLEGFEKELKISGKTIERANAEQVTLMSKYDRLKVEIGCLCDYFEAQVKVAKSTALKNYYSFAKKDHGERMVDKIVDGDGEYNKMILLFNEVNERYQKAKSIVECFQQRAYALNNIVKARVAAIEDQIIDDD